MPQVSYETKAAIRALPGKAVPPWKDGDARCHCTHCDLCGLLFRTEDIGIHIDECQAALIAALNKTEVKTMDRRDEPITYGVLIDLLRKQAEEIAKSNRWNDDPASKTAKEETEDLAASIASLLESHIEADAVDDANVRDMRRETAVPAKIAKAKRLGTMRAIQREVGKLADEVDGVTSDLHTAAAQTRERFATKLEEGILRVDALLKKMCELRARI